MRSQAWEQPMRIAQAVLLALAAVVSFAPSTAFAGCAGRSHGRLDPHPLAAVSHLSIIDASLSHDSLDNSPLSSERTPVCQGPTCSGRIPAQEPAPASTAPETSRADLWAFLPVALISSKTAFRTNFAAVPSGQPVRRPQSPSREGGLGRREFQ